MRGGGLKAGIYYSGGIDGTFYKNALSAKNPDVVKLLLQVEAATFTSRAVHLINCAWTA